MIKGFSDAVFCPYCGGETKVTDTRHAIKYDRTLRRRTCKNCKAVYRTVEIILDELEDSQQKA